MSELDLFPGPPPKGGQHRGVGGEGRDLPLAARMRPRTLSEFKGQEHLLGEGKALRVMMERGELKSMILWGPPGSGKTTLALTIVANAQKAGPTRPSRPFLP